MALTEKVEKILQRQFNEVVKEGEQTMKAFAPYPRGTMEGLGSYSTGETKRGIHTEKSGKFKAFVGVSNDHAQYAERGRRSISAKGKPMIWYDKRGRKHVAYKVRAMEGWHFVEKTANMMRAKYGG